MEVDEEIAGILLDPETKQVLAITLYEENLRFACGRCATLCCKLGGPRLTKKDVERITQAGYETSEFLVPFKGGSKASPTFRGSLKSRKDGSCVFLRTNPENGDYECSIYDFRPALCRLYPFDFRKINPQYIALRVIPCCRGLNDPDGELINERFIGSLLDAIFDLAF